VYGIVYLRSLGVKFFALHRVEASDIMLTDWVKNLEKELEPRKSLFSFFKWSLNRKKYVIIEKNKLLITLRWN
jgi:hypothetical protein